MGRNIIIVCLSVALLGLIYCNREVTTGEEEEYRDTVYDTIPYYMPVSKEEKLLGNITAKLPVSVPKLPENDKNVQNSVANFGKSVPKDHFEDMSEKVTPDSADVVIPITQKVYEDSTYTAYVSGYNSQLDSLIFRMPREVTTITNTHYQKPTRWSIGIQVGYGMTLKGTPQFAPYVGIGVSYRLINF